MNQGSTLLQFSDGEVKILDHGRYDVEATMNVEWFSSLIMGVVDFRSLWTYRLAQVSDDAKVGNLHRLFHSWDKPVTMEEF